MYLSIFMFSDGRVTESVQGIIRGLLVLDPMKRLTASQLVDALSTAVALWQNILANPLPLQVVPEMPHEGERGRKDRDGMSHLEIFLRKAAIAVSYFCLDLVCASMYYLFVHFHTGESMNS